MDILLMIIAILILSSAMFIYILILKKNEALKRTLRLSFLKVTVPKKSSADAQDDTTRDFKETISVMEQLLVGLKSIEAGNLRSKLLGQETFSFEYIAHEGEIFFYVVCPVDFKDLFERQITSFYTDAIIEETPDINIFEGKKHYLATTIVLKKEFYFPIKTYQHLESDPINNITNAFSKFRDDESGAFQIVLSPVGDSWQEDAYNISSQIQDGKSGSSFSLNPIKLAIGTIKLFIPSRDDEDSTPDRSGPSQTDQERSKIIGEKATKTGYSINIRIVLSGNSKITLKPSMQNIVSSFRQFNLPLGNSLTKRDGNVDKIIKDYIYRVYNWSYFKTSDILNIEEISSIFHFPHSKYNKTPGIIWQNFKIVQAPSNIPKEGIAIGDNIYRGVKKEIKIKNEDRFRHFYVIGQTGTGKSSILQVMARQDLQNGKGVAVIDPHGDLVNDLVPFIPRSRADDVIIFNPADTQRPIGLNLLEAKNPEERGLIADDRLNIMIKLFGNEIFGPRLQDYFRNGVYALMEYEGGGALTDIVRLFTDEEFQQERVRQITNPIVKAWWTETYASMGDREKQEIIPYFSAKFSGFITNATVRNIIGQIESSFDIGEVMNEGKIIMVNLSKGVLGDLNSELLGLILVSKIQIAAMRRQNIRKADRKDFFMYIDEFQNYVTPAIESILSEARKYRLGLILAHQYLGQLEKSDALTGSSLNLKQAIFGNVGSVMSYKIGPEDGEFLEKYYAPVFSSQDLVNMDKFKGVMKIAIDNQPSTPFSIIPKNPYLQAGDERAAKAFFELSRLKYGRDRMFIQKEIEYRIGVV